MSGNPNSLPPISTDGRVQVDVSQQYAPPSPNPPSPAAKILPNCSWNVNEEAARFDLQAPITSISCPIAETSSPWRSVGASQEQESSVKSRSVGPFPDRTVKSNDRSGQRGSCGRRSGNAPRSTSCGPLMLNTSPNELPELDQLGSWTGGHDDAPPMMSFYDVDGPLSLGSNMK